MSGRYDYPPAGGNVRPHGWGAPAVSDPDCRCIRISNLANTVSEDDLHRIFSQLGTLTDVWVVVDAQNHPLGSAFCEFQESDKVQIAVAHLNNVSFKGKSIRIEPTPNNTWKEERNRIRNGHRVVEEQPAPRPLPVSTPAPSHQDSAENLANLNSEQMFNLMHQMKLCIEADPIRARDALLRNFTLSAGMLQALLMMKLVDPAEALEVLMSDEVQPPPNPTPVHLPPPGYPVGPPKHEAPIQAPLPIYSQPPVPQGYGPPPNMAMDQRHVPAMDPRQARGMRPGYGPPPPRNYPPQNIPPPQQQMSPPVTTQIETERAAMLMQLIQMTDQQLNALAPEQRQAVIMLREQLALQM